MINLLISNSDSSTVDLVCTLPIAQQFIGGASLLYDIAKLTNLIKTRLFKELNYLHNNTTPLDKNKFRHDNNKDLYKYSYDFILNTIRFIPIAGTVLSIVRLVGWLIFSGHPECSKT